MFETEVADRLEIMQLMYTYCRAMDRIDHEIGYSVWHDDGDADYGSIFRGTGREFVDWVLDLHASLVDHSHQVSNILIEIDGNRAASESYLTVALRQMADGQLFQMTGCGRYLDRLEKRGGRWGIVKRVYVHDFDRLDPVSQVQVEGWGRRDRSDPSYRVLS